MQICKETDMSRIFLVNGSCADQSVDAVVNAANSGLWAGGGICGVIFKKAGMSALTAACSKYKTPLTDGSAVITPAFQSGFFRKQRKILAPVTHIKFIGAADDVAQNRSVHIISLLVCMLLILGFSPNIPGAVFFGY